MAFGLGLGLGKKSAADLIRRGQSPPIIAPGHFFGVRLSPPESASADPLADWLADPIGSDRIRRGLSPPIIVPICRTLQVCQ